MFKSLLLGTIVLLLPAPGIAAASPLAQPEDLAGTWDLSFDTAGTNCRILLRPQKSDKGDYFLGLPVACRHAMPALARVGRWSMGDARHLTLSDPAGASLLTFERGGGSFTARSAAGTYALKAVAVTGRSAAGFRAIDVAPSDDTISALELVATRHRRAAADTEVAESTSDIAGRYAVMREKRDTGCMLTLDTTRVAGGARAQLAPACRDQGIVVFDPAAWQIIKGRLVLTARAGHKAELAKDGEGAWKKDPNDGKPLGLKKL